MASETTKTVEVMLDKFTETYEHQEQMLSLTDFQKPDMAALQNAGNVIWEPVQQHAPDIVGWDLTGNETGIIEEAYPCKLDDNPHGDIVDIRADDLRDNRYWERRAEQSAKKQATVLNSAIASKIATQGSLFYRSNATSGFDFIAEAQAIMNERQGVNNGRNFLLNDRDTKTYASELSGRETVKGRPETAWQKGQIGSQVAEFDIFTGSFLPSLVGGADPATTVTGNQSFKPEAGSVSNDVSVTNTDYRTADIPVAASANYNVGDKVTFSNGGTAVQSVGLADKTVTGQSMTFTIVAKPDATTITVFPKPIALDDPALTTLEAAYANINTRILNAATVDRLNTDATNRTNLFWDKYAVKVLGGTLPANKWNEFGGMKVVPMTMSNGQEMYMLYDGDITKATFRFRILNWYGITIANPSNCGCAVTF